MTCITTAVVIHKFVRDMYSKRFPELESLVHTPLEYIKTVQVHIPVHLVQGELLLYICMHMKKLPTSLVAQQY